MTAVGEALYGKKEQPAIIIQASGDPGDDEGMDVQLDPEHPEESVAILRRWRLEQLNGGADEIELRNSNLVFLSLSRGRYELPFEAY